MSNEIIYLEPSEEITGVIDKLRANPAHSIAFVIPRGATIAQSIVNLKLLKRSATEMDKEISLIANDRISRNLASQIGLTVYSKVSEAERAKPEISVPEKKSETTDLDHEEDQNGQFKVNNYYRNKKDDSDDEDKEEMKKELEDIGKTPEKSPEEDVPKMEMSSRPVGEHYSEERHYNEEEPPEEHRHEHVNHMEQKKEDVNFKSMSNKPTNIKGSRKPIIILLSIAAVALIVLAYLFLPYTTITVQVKTDDFKAEKQIAVDRNAEAKDANKLVLPGKLLEQEKETTKTFDATGTKDAGTKASGKLKVYNSLDTSAHAIAKGTKFTSGGKTFLSQADVTVPAATPTLVNGVPGVDPGVSGDVSVTADQTGDSYNVPAGDFSISGSSSKITGKSTAAMAGGVTKTIKVVSADDLAKAEASIKADIETSGKTDLLDLAKKSKLSIFDNSEKSETISSSSTKNENDEADKFDYTLKIKLFAIGFVKSDLDNLFIENLNSGLGQDKMLINPEKAEIKYDLTDNNIDTGVLTLDAIFTGKSGSKISEEAIKKEAKGKMTTSAKQAISGNAGVETVEVKNWPSKMPEVPWLTKRIKVIFDYAK